MISRSCRVTGRSGFSFAMKVRDVTVSGSLRCFHADLATWLGINPALVFERLRYLFDYEGNGRMMGGHRWIFNTYPQWKESHFPWMCERNVQYAFRVLEQKGLIVSVQPDGASRKKYYRIADGAMDVEFSHDAESASSKTQKLRLPKTSKDNACMFFPKGKMCPSATDPEASETMKAFDRVRENLLNPSKQTPSAEHTSTAGSEPIGCALNCIEDDGRPIPKPRRGVAPTPEEFELFIRRNDLDSLCSITLYRRFSNPKAKKHFGIISNWQAFLRGLHKKNTKHLDQ